MSQIIAGAGAGVVQQEHLLQRIHALGKEFSCLTRNFSWRRDVQIVETQQRVDETIQDVRCWRCGILLVPASVGYF